MPEPTPADQPPFTAAQPPTLYLIDGYAQFFRAYHAIRTPMSSPVTKEPTNLTFGFLGMLLKLLRGEGRIAGAAPGSALKPNPRPGCFAPEYVAVVLDVSGDRGTFRSQLYPDYKAHRPPPPEDLGVQVDRCLKTLERLGVPVIGAEGFEADDCAAALVDRLAQSHPDLRIRIISKDKDLKQLLRKHNGAGVELYDIHTDEVFTQETLKADTGLTPAQVIDMLALMGDNVDNVPGVEGVGPKTAAKLVSEHGSLDGVLDAAAAGKIKGKMGERLAAAAADRAPLHLSRRLVTLRHDVPVEFDLESAASSRIRLAELIPVLKELGFNRYQDEVRALMGEDPAHAPSAGAGRASPTTPAASTGPSTNAGRPRAGSTDAPTGFMTLFDLGASGPSGVASAAPVGDIRPQSGEYTAITSREALVSYLDEVRRVIKENPDAALAIDTETTGLSPLACRLCGVCLSIRPGAGVYVPVRSPDSARHMDEATVVGLLKDILEDPSVPKCGHNLKFDSLVLRQVGIDVAGFQSGERGPSGAGSGRSSVFDSMIASYLIDATRSSHSLDALSMALLGRTNISIKDLIGSGKEQRTFDTVPLEAATQYAAEDADVALQLRQVMLPQLRAMGLIDLFERLEMPLVEVLAELEHNGVRVDRGELDRQRNRLLERIADLRRQIDEESKQRLGRTFNPDSPRQLAGALFNKPETAYDPEDPVGSGPGLGLKPIKRIKTGYSTDAEVLETLAQDPEIGTNIPSLIVEYRELTKLVSTYLVALAEAINPRTGRVHSSFNQTVAVTGRLASSDPNLQNIPIRTEVGREIRRAFVADPGHVLVSADYSQIELRLLAHLSKDPALIEAFLQGEDIHTTVAAQIAGVAADKVTKQQRSAAKMVNFGIVYGITPFGLARRLGVSNTQASEIIDGYKRRFSGITTFLQECIDQAQRLGYVETMLGRRRAIPEIHSTIPARRSLAERTAINTVVQGSAADLIKLAMVEIFRDLRRSASSAGAGGPKAATKPKAPAPAIAPPSGLRMLLQIHDELVFECPREVGEQARAYVVHRMEHAAETWTPPDGAGLNLRVPIRVDASIAENWFDGK